MASSRMIWVRCRLCYAHGAGALKLPSQTQPCRRAYAPLDSHHLRSQAQCTRRLLEGQLRCAGLGKTAQIIALITLLVEQRGEAGRYLIVAPASVLTHWLDEIARFSPRLRVAAYRGTYDERTDTYEREVRVCARVCSVPVSGL